MPLLHPDHKDEVEWDGDNEVDVTVDLEENGLVAIEVRWKPELGRHPRVTPATTPQTGFE